jgi:hypothetical protein
MFENRHFETQMKLFLKNNLKPCLGLENMKIIIKKKNQVEPFKIVSYMDPMVLIKTRDPPKIGN